MFRRIKTEIFFIYRLLKEGYGPRFWWPYAKYRFFWRFLLSDVPRYDYEPDRDLELHSVFQKKDLWMLIWSFRSFLDMTGLRPVLVLHDDGSVDEKTAEIIKSKFPNSKVLFRQKTADLIAEMPDVPDIIKQTRKKCHFFLNRPINIIALSKAKKLILADSDILYFNRPSEVADFLTGKTNFDAIMGRSPENPDHKTFDIGMDDYYTNKYGLKESQSRFIDGGYIMIDRNKMTFDKMIEFLNHTKKPITNYFIEMSYFACILSQLNLGLLPPDRYQIKGPVTDKTITKHFTSPRRYEMFAYGFDKIKQVLKSHEKI